MPARRPARALLLAAALIALPACSFEEPPPPADSAPTVPGPDQPAVPAPSGSFGPCTDYALTLLDGQLVGLPSVSPQVADRGNAVVKQFVQRYDEVIVSSGIPAARERFTPEIVAACGE
jgi:hypothetical protein